MPTFVGSKYATIHYAMKIWTKVYGDPEDIALGTVGSIFILDCTRKHFEQYNEIYQILTREGKSEFYGFIQRYLYEKPHLQDMAHKNKWI